MRRISSIAYTGGPNTGVIADSIYVLSGKTAQKTINATKLLQIILQTIDGKGGGKKDRAQAGISTSITQVQSKLTKIK